MGHWPNGQWGNGGILIIFLVGKKKNKTVFFQPVRVEYS